jgi:hypothetical protein
VSALVVVEATASGLAGWMIVEVAFGAKGRSANERFLRVSIAFLLGLGILSASYAIALFADLDQRIEPLFPLSLAAGCAPFLIMRRRHTAADGVPASSRIQGERESKAPRPATLTRVMFMAALLVASATVIEHTLREPEGGFDGWAIWNSRARSLFRASSPTQEAFSPALARAQFRTHPDYPLLLPGLVVEGFRLIGCESIITPAVTAIVFGSLLVSLVTFGLAELLGAGWGLLAGSILLSAPIFVTLVVRQCADIPLATYVFTAVLIAVFVDRTEARRRLSLIALAGFTLSFAAWCKNEGVVFLLAVPIAFLLRRGTVRMDPRARATEALAWALGALPIVALVVVFKLHFAPRNDLVSASGWELVSPLLSPFRWWQVASAIGKRIIALQEWGPHLVATIVIGVLLLFRRRQSMNVDPMARPIALALALVALAYGAVYLLTPHDAVWQVRYTFDRLAFQCWPSALLAIFLVMATPVASRE